MNLYMAERIRVVYYDEPSENSVCRSDEMILLLVVLLYIDILIATDLETVICKENKMQLFVFC